LTTTITYYSPKSNNKREEKINIGGNTHIYFLIFFGFQTSYLAYRHIQDMIDRHSDRHIQNMIAQKKTKKNQGHFFYSFQRKAPL